MKFNRCCGKCFSVFGISSPSLFICLFCCCMWSDSKRHQQEKKTINFGISWVTKVNWIRLWIIIVVDCEGSLFDDTQTFIPSPSIRASEIGKISRKIQMAAEWPWIILSLHVDVVLFFKVFSSKNTTNVCQWTNSNQQLVFGSFWCWKSRSKEEKKKTCC